jgi:hypothetical protein
MPRPGERGVPGLERGDLRPADERGRGQHLVPACSDLLGDRRVLRRQVD